MNKSAITYRFGLVLVAMALVSYGAYTLLTGTDGIPPKLQTLTDGTIEVLEASYGLNCSPDFPVISGNATGRVRAACNASKHCDFNVRVDELGDPAGGCSKDFAVQWRCVSQEASFSSVVPGEANGKSVSLDCKSDTNGP